MESENKLDGFLVDGTDPMNICLPGVDRYGILLVLKDFPGV